MHYSDMVYRPPYEADSVLLQVTTGCSHNKCTFCTMYRDVNFRISPMNEIEEDLEEVRTYRPSADRVFLESGDAFALSADRLLAIGEKIHNALPRVSMITGYATIMNVASKTDEELRALAAAGFGEINIGLESGLDEVLSFMNKGYSLDFARRQLTRLKEAGMPFSLNIINAAAGPEKIEQHAAANAAICNEMQPYLIFISPLHVDPGSDLEKIAEAGGFRESTLGQYISEEIEFLEQLEMEDTVFFGIHVSNPIKVLGQLPGEKDRLLKELKTGMHRLSESWLNAHPTKGPEGRLYAFV